jgi:hypothetical protein
MKNKATTSLFRKHQPILLIFSAEIIKSGNIRNNAINITHHLQ